MARRTKEADAAPVNGTNGKHDDLAEKYSAIDPVHWKKVNELRMAANEAESEWIDAREEAKDRKKAFEAADSALRKHLDRVLNGDEQELLADADPLTSDAAPQPDESWKDIPLAEAIPEVGANILKKLDDANIRTMGELAAFTAAHQLTDVPGIGPKAVEKIDAATERFWRERAEGRPPQTEPPAAEADATEPAEGEVIDAEFTVTPDEPRATEHQAAEASEADLVAAKE